MNRIVLSIFLALAAVNTATSTPLLLDTIGGVAGGLPVVGSLTGGGGGGLLGGLVENLLNTVGDVLGGEGGLLGGILGGDGGLLGGGEGGLLGGIIDTESGLLTGIVGSLLDVLLGGGTTALAEQTAIAIQAAYSFFEILCKLMERYLNLLECFMNNWERMLNDTVDFGKLFNRTAMWFGFTIKSFSTTSPEGIAKITRLLLNSTMSVANTLFLGPQSFMTQYLTSTDGPMFSILSAIFPKDVAKAIILRVLGGDLSTIVNKPDRLLGLLNTVIGGQNTGQLAGDIATGGTGGSDDDGLLDPVLELVGGLLD